MDFTNYIVVQYVLDIFTQGSMIMIKLDDLQNEILNKFKIEQNYIHILTY
jgi:hypothetical protein